ncbi:MAG: hypothetical protein ACM37W_07415 [Actinomycetota bacterium]
MTVMQSQGDVNQTSVIKMVERIFTSRKITRIDQQKLMSVLLSKDTLTTEEHEQIDRVFDGLRRGVLRVID